MNDISLQNLRKCYDKYRQYLVESKFTTQNGLRHYKDHVYDVGPNLQYSKGDFQGHHAGPYYEYMTFEEYCNRAEELTLTKADLWDSNKQVIGCTIHDNTNGFRLLKMRNSLEMIKDKDPLEFDDIVIYVDSSIVKVGGKDTGDVIITYYPIKGEKAWNRFDKQKVAELPENIPDEPVNEDYISPEFLEIYDSI